MRNLFPSVLVALALTLGMSWSAAAQQSKAPARGPVAAETTGVVNKPAPSTATSTSAPADQTTPAAAEEADQSNIVLFTGTIKQDKQLKALPGATVYVRATKQMAVADENGDFSLELDFGNGPVDLDVSYAGFEDQSVSIADPNLFLVISMTPRKKK